MKSTLLLLVLGLISSAPAASATAQRQALAPTPPTSATHALYADVVQRPDVLIVILDDVSDTALDQSGPLPAIDGLQARGIRYRRAYSMPTCGPTRATLNLGVYTGRDLGSCTAPVVGVTPDPSVVFLADYAHGAGYACGLIGKWHVGSSLLPGLAAPTRQGHGEWRAGTYDNVVSACGVGKGYWRWQRIDADERGFTQGVVTTFVTESQRDELIDWWTTTPSPRFAVWGLNAPHGPHAPGDAPPAYLLPPGYPTPVTPREVYESQIVAADTALGEVLAYVDPSTTLVCVIGDNGTPTGIAIAPEEPTKVKGTTFEGGIKVPMIWAGPGVASGVQTWNLAHIVDVMPTLALRFGMEVSATDGIPLRLQDGYETRQLAYSDYQPLIMNAVRDRAAYEWRWKVRRVGPTSAYTEELYDLLSDPYEQVPLPLNMGNPGVVMALVAELNEHE